jgi:hypothetical protein
MFKIIENNIYFIFYSLLANDIIFNIAMPPSENTKRTLTIAFKGKNLHLASNHCFVPCKKEASTFWKSFKKSIGYLFERVFMQPQPATWKDASFFATSPGGFSPK